MDKKLVYENKLCKVYTDSMCKCLTDSCERWMNDNPPLKNHKVYICETNTGDSRFVLFDDQGEPIAESSGAEDMDIKIGMLRFLKKSKGDE